MGEKNRFSRLLDQMMSAVNLKNYALSNALKYDVSYISKWVNGHMLPSEKTADQTISAIVSCVLTAANEEQKQGLMSNYRVRNEQELEGAMYDHLKCEYDYTRAQQKSQETAGMAKISYYPSLSLAQFITEMNHPVLRRVSSLNIMASMDLFYMEHEYRLQIVNVQREWEHPDLFFPDVHFSLAIDVERWDDDIVYDTIFLLNLLSSSTYIDFKLYGSTRSRGHILFAVENEFSITGLLMNHNQCLSVVASEENDTAQAMYYGIKNHCIRENLLFRRSTMAGMFRENVYIQTLLGQDNCWLLGHMTEHFLPDDLFEELLEENLEKMEGLDGDGLRKIHQLTHNVLETVPLRILIYETAFQNLVLKRSLDFFNRKIVLTEEQCERYLQHLIHLIRDRLKSRFRLVHGQFVADYRYVTTQCLFINDTVSHLRLENHLENGMLLAVNRQDVHERLRHFFEEIWARRSDVVISDEMEIDSYLNNMLNHIKMISKLR